MGLMPEALTMCGGFRHGRSWYRLGFKSQSFRIT